ncbi:MAG: hypothetical protein ACFE8N_04775 [Promethearchaeota archaeon]
MKTHKGLFWLTQLLTVTIAMCIFYPVIVVIDKKHKNDSNKKKIKYKNEKRAKLCIRTLILGLSMMLSGTGAVMYSLAFLHNERYIFLIEWILAIVVFVGFFITIFGFKLALHGALAEDK